MEEDEYMFKFYHIKPTGIIAGNLDRTVKAIHARANHLGLKKHVSSRSSIHYKKILPESRWLLIGKFLSLLWRYGKEAERCNVEPDIGRFLAEYRKIGAKLQNDTKRGD